MNPKIQHTPVTMILGLGQPGSMHLVVTRIKLLIVLLSISLREDVVQCSSLEKLPYIAYSREIIIANVLTLSPKKIKN